MLPALRSQDRTCVSWQQNSKQDQWSCQQLCRFGHRSCIGAHPFGLHPLYRYIRQSGTFHRSGPLPRRHGIGQPVDFHRWSVCRWCFGCRHLENDRYGKIIFLQQTAVSSGSTCVCSLFAFMSAIPYGNVMWGLFVFVKGFANCILQNLRFRLLNADY